MSRAARFLFSTAAPPIRDRVVRPKNGEIGGSEEPKSTTKSLILEVNGALRLHTKINVKVQELNVK